MTYPLEHPKVSLTANALYLGCVDSRFVRLDAEFAWNEDAFHSGVLGAGASLLVPPFATDTMRQITGAHSVKPFDTLTLALHIYCGAITGWIKNGRLPKINPASVDDLLELAPKAAERADRGLKNAGIEGIQIDGLITRVVPGADSRPQGEILERMTLIKP